MMELIIALMGRAEVKEVEYRYVFRPPEGGQLAEAVCVG